MEPIVNNVAGFNMVGKTVKAIVVRRLDRDQVLPVELEIEFTDGTIIRVQSNTPLFAMDTTTGQYGRGPIP